MDSKKRRNDIKAAMVHFNDLKTGMVLATTLNTKDGRRILAADTVINETLLPGLKNLPGEKP